MTSTRRLTQSSNTMMFTRLNYLKIETRRLKIQRSKYVSLYRLKLLAMHIWLLQVSNSVQNIPKIFGGVIQKIMNYIRLTGIPVRNGVSHVREIARMSLRLMETVKVMWIVMVMIVLVVVMLVVMVVMERVKLWTRCQ